MRLIPLITLLLLFFTESAFAHILFGQATDSLTEPEHSFVNPAHLLAIAALGLRLGQNSEDKVIYTIVIFGLSLLVGHSASLLSFSSSYFESALLVITIILGFLTLMGINLRRFEISLTPIVVAILIGMSSGVAAQNLTENLTILTNSAIRCFFIYVCWVFFIWIVSSLNRDWIKIGIRVLASWNTAIVALVISLFLDT
ncbi:MAG: HupE/UreJ family protein [Rhizobiales bacterium]|nr:HupE/UreJ family protein [Hyphomicrobiales bacterium]